MESLESHLEGPEIEPYHDELKIVVSPSVKNLSISTSPEETNPQDPQPNSSPTQEYCNLTAEFSTDKVFASCEEVIQCCHDRSANHAMYEINLRYFLKTWSTLYPTAVSYLNTQWLARKEQFVYAWTNNILHLGITTTNRAESEHAALKNFLRCSTGDFLKCWQDMDNQWVTRVINIRASFEKSKTVAVHAYSQSLVTRRLEYNVSHAALQLISVELTSMGKSRFRGRCLCIIRKTHGLPCACEILNSHKNGNQISLDSIHEHWKQLSMIPAHEKVASVFDWEDLFENCSRFLNSS